MYKTIPFELKKRYSQTDTANLTKLKLNINDCVAQSVEQFIRNERVVGCR